MGDKAEEMERFLLECIRGLFLMWLIMTRFGLVVDAAKQVVYATTTPPASDEAPIQDAVKPEAVPKSDESAPSQNTAKPDGSSTQEEDMGWDEIEDMSSIDGKETSRSSGGCPNRAELRKRLSAAEEDEDLSWDIEDDDDEDSSSKA
ncbi:unnamed protein product [Eruca vesicaria subsp. sativa]|uniref:Uncharacterized protein n=1 Tax=Eruca vesicaria subsp. sativa TaxID=29727 RepID=A0ABC8LQD8_ERUVS|nr:unnamed protein product [Eruca vesicaria subsp. sativa]